MAPFSHIVLAGLSGVILWLLARRIVRIQPSDQGAFVKLLGAVLLLTVGFLGILSLRTVPEIHDGSATWTYVQETRYYAWVLVLIQCWSVWELFRPQSQRIVRWFWMGFLAVAWSVGICHGLYRHGVAIFSAEHHATRWSEEEQDILSFFESIRTQDKRVFVMSGEGIRNRDLATVACLAGAILVESPLSVTGSDSLVVTGE